MEKGLERKMLPDFVPQPDDDMIICRCEEITKGEIRQAVHMGMWTMTEMKKYIRPGMGLCQGMSCGKHVKNIIAKELGISPNELIDITPRPPMRAIEMGILGNEVKSDE